MRDLAAMFSELSELTACAAPSGFERAVAEYIRRQLPEARLRHDGLGNVAVTLGRSDARHKLLLLAHMDEVGLVISATGPDGSVYALPLGLVDLAVVAGCPLQVVTSDGPRAAIASTRPAHLAELATSGASAGGVWLDVGATCAGEVESLGIGPGDLVCYDTPLRHLAGTRVAGKSLDNRIGCHLLLDLARGATLGEDWSVVLGFTVQEEIGARGAEVLVRAEAPTAAIVVDTVTASDAHHVPEPLATVRVGGGPIVRAMDMFSPGGAVVTRGLVYSRRLRRLAAETATEQGTAIQHDVARTWTDGGQACSSNTTGVPTLGIYVARRGSHSPTEVADLADVESTARLLLGVVHAITTDPALDLSTPW